MNKYFGAVVLSASLALGWQSARFLEPAFNKSPNKATLNASAGSVQRPSRPLVLPSITLPFLMNGSTWPSPEFSIANGASPRHTLYIVFTEADCDKTTADVPFWNTLATEFAPDVFVVGVISGPSSPRLRYFLEREHITIPILHDSASVITDAVYNAGVLTPSKILVDADGKILRINGATNGVDSAQTVYRTSLVEALSHSRASGQSK